MSEPLSESTRALANEAAAALVGDIFGEGDEGEPEAPSGPTGEYEEPVTQGEGEVTDDVIELPDLRIDLDDEDDDLFEDELPASPIDEEEEFTPVNQIEEYEDEDTLRARLAQAERKAQHYERLRADEARKRWKTEAVKRYPLSAAIVDEIKATSKRSFLREAKKAHISIAPVVKPYVDAYNKLRAEARTEVRGEVETEVAEAWGKPTTGPGTAPVRAAQNQGKIDQARARGDLSGVIKERFEQGLRV